jgi:hypothetical protein
MKPCFSFSTVLDARRWSRTWWMEGGVRAEARAEVKRR